jgi:hypothetical protein
MAIPRNYKTLRAMSGADDTGPAAAGATWAALGSSAVEVQDSLDPTRKIAGMIIRIKGTDAENEAGAWTLLAAKESGDPFQTVAYGTYTLGATATGTTNEFYADTIVVTASSWPTTVSATTALQYNLGTGVVAGAGIALLTLDTLEHRYWILKMNTDTAATCGAEFTTYE